MSIVITGATGQLGSLIINQLLKHVPPSSIIATTRNTTSPKAQTLISQGITLHQADFSQPLTLFSAFKGASKLLIVSVDKLAGAYEDHVNAIDAAKSAGVGKVFYTSQIGMESVSKGSKGHAGFLDTHKATEEYLAKSGMEYTSLRNGFYMSSLGFMLGDWEKTGKITAPEDGKVSWTSHGDLAEGIAKILLRDESEKYISLANDKSWDFEDVARILCGITGQNISREIAPEQEFKELKIKFGVPQEYAEMIIGGYRGMKAGEFLTQEKGVLNSLLGRECEGLDVFLKER